MDPLLGSAVSRKFSGYGNAPWPGTVTRGPDDKGMFCVAWVDPRDRAVVDHQWHKRCDVERWVTRRGPEDPPMRRRTSPFRRGRASRCRARARCRSPRISWRRRSPAASPSFRTEFASERRARGVGLQAGEVFLRGRGAASGDRREESKTRRVRASRGVYSGDSFSVLLLREFTPTLYDPAEP